MAAEVSTGAIKIVQEDGEEGKPSQITIDVDMNVNIKLDGLLDMDDDSLSLLSEASETK